MKRIVSAATAVILALALSIGAFAEDDGTGRADQRIAALEQRQQRISEAQETAQSRQAELSTKAGEYEAFREELADTRLLILDNRQANLDVIAQTNQLRLELTNTLKGLQDAGTALPDETAAQLKDYNAQVKEITDALRATKGQITDIAEKNKGSIRDKDYAAIDAAYQEIAAVQTWRYEQLTDINRLLQSMNALLDGSSAL